MLHQSRVSDSVLSSMHIQAYQMYTEERKNIRQAKQ
jgi:hypothetical protein